MVDDFQKTVDKHHMEIAELKIKYLSNEYLPAVQKAIGNCDLEKMLQNMQWAKASLEGLRREVINIKDKSEQKKYDRWHDNLNDKFQSLLLDAVNSCECKSKK